MRLVTFLPPDGPARAGALVGDAALVDLAAAAPLALEEAENLPWDLLSLLRGDHDSVNMMTAEIVLAAALATSGLTDEEYAAELVSNLARDGGMSIGGATMIFPLNQVRLLAPLPQPNSLREFASFEAHVAALAALAEQRIPSEWYRTHGFAFVNHTAIIGPDAPLEAPPSEALDYQLQLAAVIGRSGRDLDPEEALDHIAGLTILNGWCARDQLAAHQPLGLGPGKARDFATSLGPALVTLDELELYHEGEGRFTLTMSAAVNGVERSRGNSSMGASFGELIAAASRNATLFPGDIIASGTVGGGCLAEQTRGLGPWLEVGDEVVFTITGLGSLKNHLI